MKTIFRAGDSVKIVNPQIFVRCGYPLTVEAVLKKNQNNWKSSIRDLIQELLPAVWDRIYIQMEESILKTLAHGKYLALNCGGYARNIYTKGREELKDFTATVIEKKVVKTGLYEYGSEEHPPYLSNQRSHVLLHVCLDLNFISGDTCFWIEAKNVEKISSQSATIKV